jgi:hypothetical protein
MSPYQVNPFGVNPLQRLLERQIDFDLLRRQRQLRCSSTPPTCAPGAARCSPPSACRPTR